MTPDGISAEDWDRVAEAACQIVNASAMDDEILCAHHTCALFEILDELESQYGRIPSILATRADFSDDPQVAIPLLEEALAVSSDDLLSMLTLHSLVSLMMGGNYNDAEMEIRLSELERLGDDQSDPWCLEEAREFRTEFERNKAERDGG